MKKVLSLICAAAVILALTVTAFAADKASGNTVKNNSVSAADRLQKKSDLMDKKLQRLEFKKYVDQKIAAVKETQSQNRDLVIQNTELKKDILASVKAIKENGGTVSEEVKNQIKAYKDQIKDIVSAMKDTKADIKAILSANKDNIKSMDREAVDSAFSQIYSIQNSRNEQLKKINGILESMKSLLQ